MIELTRTADWVLLTWLRNRLAEEEIPAVVFDGDSLGLYPGTGDPVLCRVMVSADDFPRARQVLEQADMVGDLTEDALLDGRVRLFQPARGYRVAVDAVFLAAAVAARPKERVLDVGTGVGASALCLASRLAEVHVTGLELQPRLADLARHNALVNDMAERVTVVTGDLLGPLPELAPESFDHVMTNPPYLEPGRANQPHDLSRAAAMVEGAAGLAEWLAFCIAMARPKGSVTVIHRADRLDEMLTAVSGRLGDVVIFPLWPGPGARPAKRVILRGRKGVATPLQIRPGLVLHQADGGYSAEAQAVLRLGQAVLGP